jgi:predicted metalloprotease
MLGACGDDDDSTTTAGETTGRQGQALPPIENLSGPRRYRQLVEATFKLLNASWPVTLREAGSNKYSPPSKLIAYEGKNGPECDGQPASPDNAEYCQPSNIIDWDQNLLLGNFYDRVGDPAVIFVLAHEYGHLIQDRLGIYYKYRLNIERELNADCLAGAWLGAVNAEIVRFTRADYEQLYQGIFDVSDPHGLPWTNPDAHGTARQRSKAVDIGARQGARDCLRELGPGFSR